METFPRWQLVSFFLIPYHGLLEPSCVGFIYFLGLLILETVRLDKLEHFIQQILSHAK